jgi:hypothetical protein
VGQITDFVEIRRDGRIIDREMTVDRMVALGWPPERIVRVTWKNDGRQVELADASGISAKVLSTYDAVALIVDNGAHLVVLNSDGTERYRLGGKIVVGGNRRGGAFRWFERARSGSPTNFGIVFERPSDRSFYELEIDAASGSIVGEWPTK